MRHLVRYIHGNHFFGVHRGGFLVHQHGRFAISDGAEVLHGSGLEVGYRNHVQLGHGVLDAEVGIVVVEEELGSRERKLRVLDLVRSGTGADRHAITLSGEALEVAYQKCHEVGRHLRCAGEADGVFPCDRARRVGDDIGVCNGGIAFGDDQADIKGRLIRRLIKRGKGPARVGRLKLRHGVISRRRPGKIEAAQSSIQNTAIRNLQGDWSGGQLPSKMKRSLLLPWIKRYLRGQGLAADLRRDRVKLKFYRVQHNRIDCLGQSQINRLLAGKGCRLQVWRQLQRVMLGTRHAGQPLCASRRR